MENRDGKHRFYAHESEGNRVPCPECGGTGKIETVSYKGRCLHCDGTGKMVIPTTREDERCESQP